MDGRLRRRQALGICVLAHIAVANLYIVEKLQKRRNIWVRDGLRERERLGAHNNILQQLRLNDADGFPSYLRMKNDTCVFIPEGIKDKIIKQTTLVDIIFAGPNSAKFSKFRHLCPAKIMSDEIM